MNCCQYEPCGSILRGRTDKKFCNRGCKTNARKQRKREEIKFKDKQFRITRILVLSMEKEDIRMEDLYKAIYK